MFRLTNRSGGGRSGGRGRDDEEIEIGCPCGQNERGQNERYMHAWYTHLVGGTYLSCDHGTRLVCELNRAARAFGDMEHRSERLWMCTRRGCAHDAHTHINTCKLYIIRIYIQYICLVSYHVLIFHRIRESHEILKTSSPFDGDICLLQQTHHDSEHG